VSLGSTEDIWLNVECPGLQSENFQPPPPEVCFKTCVAMKFVDDDDDDDDGLTEKMFSCSSVNSCHNETQLAGVFHQVLK